MGNCALPPAWCSWASRNGCTTNGRGGNTAAGREEEHVSKAPTLPLDILLEILARADVVTLVRCAAASKYLRRHIADPAFLHRYHADAGCVPSLLLGMFQQHGKHRPCRFVSMSPSTKLTLQLTPPTGASDDFFDSCVPVTSRAGLVLLRRVHDRNLIELCVYSPVSGRYSFLPPATLYEYNNSHVLLPGDEDDNTGHSFRLLVVDNTCRTQIFSSRTGSWGSITETSGALPPGTYRRVQPAAVVLRGVAHWLCLHQSSGRYGVLAIRIADGQAAVIGEVPESCQGRRRRNMTGNTRREYKELLLASTDGRQLSLLVSEVLAISVWTLSEDARSWGARREVVNTMSMLRSVKLHLNILACAVHVELVWFGEASGAVVLKVEGAGILVLNLKTKEIAQLCVSRERDLVSLRCSPYEVDLVSLLAGLQPF